jgi:hypothetical protein
MSNNINHPPRLNRALSGVNHISAEPESVPRPINRALSSVNHISAEPESEYDNRKNRKNGKNRNNGKTKGGRRTRARKHKIYHRRRTCKK